MKGRYAFSLSIDAVTKQDVYFSGNVWHQNIQDSLNNSSCICMNMHKYIR